MEAHARLLLESYERLTGRKLIEYDANAGTAAEALDAAPFALLSHGTEADPVLNYGNRQALALWEMDWESFTSMPSRLTAEPIAREDREKLLADAKRQGYSDGYRGVRIASSGRRFEILEATIWSLVDEGGAYRGQAAMFPRWRPL